VRFDVALATCFFHNSLTGHAEHGVRDAIAAALSALTGRTWCTSAGHSDQQLDGCSCALFTLRNIFRLGLGSHSGEVLAPAGWPTFFRIHWLALLSQSGVRRVDPLQTNDLVPSSTVGLVVMFHSIVNSALLRLCAADLFSGSTPAYTPWSGFSFIPTYVYVYQLIVLTLTLILYFVSFIRHYPFRLLSS
jgi:hypothetical protein